MYYIYQYFHTSEALRWMNEYTRYSAIRYEGDTICAFLFVFLHTEPYWKELYSKTIEFSSAL